MPHRFSLIIYFLFLLLYLTSTELLNENVREGKSSYEDPDIGDDLVVPENSSDWRKPISSLSRSTVDRLRKRLPPKYENNRNLCYCNYSPDGCGGLDNETCLKFTEAACFYFAKKVYDEEVGDYVIEEKYGCAPLSVGSGGSYLTCYAHLVAHHEPMGIQCCYEGNYCNINLTISHFLEKKRYVNIATSMVLWTVFTVVGCIAIVLLSCFFTRRLAQKKFKTSLKDIASSVPDGYTDKSPMIIDISSGSGSGLASLNEKTVAHSLETICVIGCGRYGEVKKAYFKGDRIVAVKSFYTKDEKSWKNEKDIYQTLMLNHENILQFVAADISSEDSITKLILVTDFHELGSLYEYLQRVDCLSMLEALELAESAACGLEHLHSKVRGTGTPVKPAIAHRDIKLKNVLVKRKGVCCIADFGLAVSEDIVNSDQPINVQVGTKRYMPPEVLSKTLNPKCFFDFKMADVYSFSLVIWGILRGVQGPYNDTPCDSGYGSTGSSSKSSVLLSRFELEPEHEIGIPRRKPIQPYDDVLPSDPSIEEMTEKVCKKKERPKLSVLWENNPVLFDVCINLRECWAENINARPTMMGIRRTLSKAILKCKKETNAIDFNKKLWYDDIM